jgi:hypothetical protein
LIALLDFIDLNDQGMFNELERWSMLRSFIWKATIEGSGPKEQKEFLREQGLDQGKPPNPGTFMVTNEKTKLEAIQPDLKANDGTQISRMFQQYILGGAGYPDWFFGYSGNANLALAKEQTRPTIWRIEDEQKLVTKILTTIFYYRVQTAKATAKITKSGSLNISESPEWKIYCKNIYPKDLVQNAVSFQAIANTLSMADTGGLIDKKNAQKIFVFAVNEMGYDHLTFEDIEENLKEQAKEFDIEKSMQDILDKANRNGKNGKDIEEPSYHEVTNQ